MGTCNEGNVGSVPDKFDRLMEPLFTEYFARPENGDLLLSLINALLSTDTGLSRLPLAPGVERPKRVCQEFCVNRFNKQHRIAA